MKLLAYAWQCMDNEPKVGSRSSTDDADISQIDYEKLAPMAGYTVGSTKTTLGKLKRKMRAHAEGLPDTPKSTVKATPKSTTPRTPAKRRAKANDADETPSKKPKGSAKASTQSKSTIARTSRLGSPTPAYPADDDEPDLQPMLVKVEDDDEARGTRDPSQRVLTEAEVVAASMPSASATDLTSDLTAAAGGYQGAFDVGHSGLDDYDFLQLE